MVFKSECLFFTPVNSELPFGLQVPTWVFSFQEKHLSGQIVLMAQGRSRVPHRTTTLNLKLLFWGGQCHICLHSVGQNKFHGWSGQWGWRYTLATRKHCSSSDKGMWCAVFLGMGTVEGVVCPGEVASLHLVFAHVRGRSAWCHHRGLDTWSWFVNMLSATKFTVPCPHFQYLNSLWELL